MKDMKWENISRYRGELMGAAMLFVLLFHIPLARHDPFFGLRRCGNVGVDMFLFLSGVGLWFSWIKQRESLAVSMKGALTHFFTNRYKRVYPAWLLIACAYYIPCYLQGRGYSRNVPDLIANITFNWSFWRVDDLTFWYVPAAMMLYCFAPFYMELIRRHPVYRWLPVLMLVWCVMVQWMRPIHGSVGHLEIFWSRVPIFFIGINVGQWVRGKKIVDGTAWWLVALAFAMTLGTCVYLEQQLHGRFPLTIERWVYIPLTISGTLLLSELFSRVPAWVNRGLRFVGMISLEFYLIHVQFVMYKITPYKLGYWPTALLTFVISLPLAWLLYKLTSALWKKC
jgi:peptidoglycan/LPS O-acetylase OafA/YrhL